MPKGIITKDEYEALPDEWKKEYAANHGAYILQVTPGKIEIEGKEVEFEFTDTTGLRSSLESEREAHRRLKGTTKSLFDDQGNLIVDPKKYKEAIEQNEKLKNAKPDEKLAKQWEEKENQLISTYDAKIKEIEAERDSISKDLEVHVLDGAITDALNGREKGKGNALVLRPHIRQHLKIAKDDEGRLVPRVIDPATGTERITSKPGGGTAPMGLDELTEEFADNPHFAANFEGSGINGTGGNGGRGGKSGVTLPDDPVERLTMVHSGEA